MAVKTRLKINGVASTITSLKNTKSRLSNTNVPIKKTVTDFFIFVQRNFRTEGGSHKLDAGRYGTKWKDLSDATVARRLRKKGRRVTLRILQDTGDLRQRWDLLVTKSKGVLKSRQDYSRIHDKGGIGSKGQRIPQRKILPGDKDGMAIAMKHFKRHVKVSTSK